MKVKIVLLQGVLNSRPIPHWDIGSITANIRGKCKEVEVVDLETGNDHTDQSDALSKKRRAADILRKENFSSVQAVINDIGSLKFDIFHFYIDWWNETLPLSVAVAHQIKKLNKKAKILVSGPYLNSYGKEISDKFRFIDYIAISEIEPVYQGFLKNPGCPEDIPNIIYFDRKKRGSIETKKHITNINNLLLPEFDLYFNRAHPRPKILPFRLSRGCQYRCFFCACLSAEKLRYYQDLDTAVNWLRKYKEVYGVESFYFEDDAFNFDNDYLEAFLDKLRKARLNIKWSAYFVAKNLSMPIIRKIKKTGCLHMRWGLESANPSILQKISKTISIPEVERILRQTEKVGISNQISAIVGFPYEKNDSIECMKKFIAKNRKSLRVFNVYCFKPRTNTLAYKFPERYGIRILKNKAVFKEDSVPFDEISGLKWEKKRIAQQLFRRSVNKVVRENKLSDIDPKEYFKEII